MAGSSAQDGLEHIRVYFVDESDAGHLRGPLRERGQAGPVDEVQPELPGIGHELLQARLDAAVQARVEAHSGPGYLLAQLITVLGLQEKQYRDLRTL